MTFLLTTPHCFASTRLPEGKTNSKLGIKSTPVCEAGGFIGSHLAKHVKREGLWINRRIMRGSMGSFADTARRSRDYIRIEWIEAH
jgi:hypothetical protein